MVRYTFKQNTKRRKVKNLITTTYHKETYYINTKHKTKSINKFNTQMMVSL